ncbi:hypothetical protein C2845_PM11G06780 [Panicum miliaceum]|uniref:SRP9 domain-containing protein n=1 Tax=Panicum miliaceum TaxID=4540 RepID=A0A3L6RSP7_PANMI|nr:hypothetical protein C2845_PM11G06780 [Panicum miliaceum]
MVYVDSWYEFVERSVQLFRTDDPSATRYVMKYRHCEGKLVLKVTDDRECGTTDWIGISSQLKGQLGQTDVGIKMSLVLLGVVV